MILNIMLFAGLTDRFGATSLQFEIRTASITAGELINQLILAYPQHEDVLQACFLACNQQYAEPDQLISQHDELALIPPVSGGQPDDDDSRYEITFEPLLVDIVTSKVSHPNHGATLAFVGTTREMTGNERTVRLEYEAYVPMALKSLRQIGDELHTKWPGTLCAISHRLGVVHISEISVVIAVSSPHRDVCYEASRYAIERLKQIVPIWKKEIWDDGSEWKGHQLGPWNPVS